MIKPAVMDESAAENVERLRLISPAADGARPSAEEPKNGPAVFARRFSALGLMVLYRWFDGIASRSMRMCKARAASRIEKVERLSRRGLTLVHALAR